MRVSKSLLLQTILLALIVAGLGLNALAAPKIVLEERGKINLGATIEGQLKQGSFTITNKGSSKLTINHYMVTCSCLKITSDFTGEIGPGESNRVEFVFDTEGLAGENAKKDVIIFSNAQNSPHRVSVITEVNPLKEFQIRPGEVLTGLTVLVDLRGHEKYVKNHILGAINVPGENFPAWVKSLPEDLTVYVYSEEGVISDDLASKLDSEVPVKIKSLVGGFLQWKTNHEDYLMGEESQ